MDEKKQYEHQRSYFDKEFSNIHEYQLAQWQISYIDRIKKSLLTKDFKKKTLLDIATGRGYVAIEMAKLGMRVIACDLSSQAIQNLRKYKKKFSLKNLQLLECPAEEIPLANKSVDFIVANSILEHIPDEKRAIDQWKRLLKPDGKMFIAVPLKFRYVWPFLWPINYIHDKRIGHLRRYDLEDLKKKFQLPITNVFYTGHLVKIFSIIVSILTRSKTHEKYFETLDKKRSAKKFGANNITVIFKDTKLRI